MKTTIKTDQIDLPLGSAGTDEGLSEMPTHQRGRVVDAADSGNDDDLDDLREKMETLAKLRRRFYEGRSSSGEPIRITGDDTLAAVMASPAIVLDLSLTREERRRRQIELNRPVIELLQSWLEDDEEPEDEQRASLEELKHGIDAHRLPGQKLFS